MPTNKLPSNIFDAMFLALEVKCRKLGIPPLREPDKNQQNKFKFHSSSFYATAVKEKPGLVLRKRKRKNPGTNTLDHIMKADDVVKKFISDKLGEAQIKTLKFGEWLHKRAHDYYNYGKYPEVVREECYRECYVKFLGYEDLKAFIRGTPKKDASQASDNGSETQTEESPGIKRYLGVFFSVKSYQCKLFFLTIDYSRPRHGKYPVQQWGFHINDDEMEQLTPDFGKPGSSTSIEFKGDAIISGRHIYCDLKALHKSMRMKMNIIGVFHETKAFFEDFDQQQIIRCSIQTISFKQYIVNVEALLLQIDENTENIIKTDPDIFLLQKAIPPGLIPEETQKTIYLYLMLQRRNFWVRSDDVFKIEELKVKKSRVADLVGKNLSSYWRIWNGGIGEKGRVVQSIMRIEGFNQKNNSPYKTYLYPYLNQDTQTNSPELKEQASVIDVNGDNLCFSSYGVRKGDQLPLLNYAIFDLRRLDKYGYAEGAFLSVGDGSSHSLIGGYCVMCKIEHYNPKDDVPRMLTIGEAEGIALHSKKQGMIEGLRLLTKKRQERNQTHLGVYGIYYTPETQKFLMIRRDHGALKNKLDFPGGQCEFNKSPDESLVHLVQQQTGLSVTHSNLRSHDSVVNVQFQVNHLDESIRYHSVGILYDLSVKVPETGYGKNTFLLTKDEMDKKLEELSEVAKVIYSKIIKTDPNYSTLRELKFEGKDAEGYINPVPMMEKFQRGTDGDASITE